MLNYIIWDVSPAIIDGFHVRWYGLFFGIGFFLSYIFAKKIFKRDGLSASEVDDFAFGLFLFLLVGLRLGHCLLYEPAEYLANPIKIFFVWEGGLASHGGAVGLLCGFLWFSKRSGKKFLWLMARVAIVVPITAFFVRMGNLMNSEIYGVATNLPWGFVFVRDALIQTNAHELSGIMAQAGLVTADTVPSLEAFLSNCLPHTAVTFESLRNILLEHGFLDVSQKKAFVDACVQSGLLTTNHPTQIYEALTYLTTGIILIAYYQLRAKHNKPISEYVIMAIILLMCFATRFCIEFIKNNQVDFEKNMTFDMGQWLSVPFILAGIVFIVLAIRESKQQETTK